MPDLIDSFRLFQPSQREREREREWRERQGMKRERERWKRETGEGERGGCREREGKERERGEWRVRGMERVRDAEREGCTERGGNGEREGNGERGGREKQGMKRDRGMHRERDAQREGEERDGGREREGCTEREGDGEREREKREECREREMEERDRGVGGRKVMRGSSFHCGVIPIRPLAQCLQLVESWRDVVTSVARRVRLRVGEPDGSWTEGMSSSSLSIDKYSSAWWYHFWKHASLASVSAYQFVGLFQFNDFPAEWHPLLWRKLRLFRLQSCKYTNY